MPDPNVVYIGQDPSPEWNAVRGWIADHYINAELLASVKAEDDALDATFIDLLSRWYQDSPDADCFEIGVDEKIGTVRLRLARRDTKPSVDVSAYTKALLEAGVSPEVIQQAQEKATVPGKEGKPFPRFDRVKDDRDRGKPAGELRLVK